MTKAKEDEAKKVFETFMAGYTSQKEIGKLRDDLAASGEGSKDRIASGRAKLEGILNETFGTPNEIAHMDATRMQKFSQGVQNKVKADAIALLKDDSKAAIDYLFDNAGDKVANNYILMAPVETGNEEFDRLAKYHKVAYDLKKDNEAIKSGKSDVGALEKYRSKVKKLTIDEFKLDLAANPKADAKATKNLVGLMGELLETCDMNDILRKAETAQVRAYSTLANQLGDKAAEYTKAMLYAKANKGEDGLKDLAEDLYTVATSEIRLKKE